MQTRTACAVLLALSLAGPAAAQPPAEAPPTLSAAPICLTNACGELARFKDTAALAAAVAAQDRLGVIGAGGTAVQTLQAALASGFIRLPDSIDLATARYVLDGNGRPQIGYLTATGLAQAWSNPDNANTIAAAMDVSGLERFGDAFPQVPQPGPYRPVNPISPTGEPLGR